MLADWTGGELVRLQCYEGIDAAQAVYEWDYSRQLLHLRAQEARGEAPREDELYSEQFLVRRPLLRAIATNGTVPPVLLVDEVDRADDEFEAFLLEILADYTITVPELGTFRAERPPIVIVTSNRTRDVHDALEAPLPLPLDRPSGLRAGARHPAGPRPRGQRGARPTDRRGRRRAARPGPVQAARGRRDHRLGAGRRRARRRHARRGDGRRHARHRREVPGRSAAGPRPRRRRARRGRRPRWLTTRTVSSSRSPAWRDASAWTSPSGATVTLGKAWAAVGLGSRDACYWAGRVVLLRRPEDAALYDQAFDAFWDGTGVARAPVPPVTVSVATDTDVDPDADPDADPTGDGDDLAVRVRWSPAEQLRTRDFAACSPAELDEAHRLIADLRLVAARRRSRRRRPTRRGRGRPDLRRTVRRSLRADGEPIRPGVHRAQRPAAARGAALRRERLHGAVRPGAGPVPPCRGGRRRPRRGVRARHAAHPAHPRAVLPRPRRGARRRGATGDGLVRRHAARGGAPRLQRPVGGRAAWRGARRS